MLGEHILQRIAPAATRAMQEAIEAAAGQEVFFAGALDGDGRIERVRVCARGHAQAVPAIFEGLKAREVTLHNHPSGNLSPSEADLQMASMYGAHGHGVYIVDNDVTRVYVVVEPFVQRKDQALNIPALTHELGPDGPMAKALPHYEDRTQQTDMMAAVSRAFNEEGIAVIEAPTGVGKTLAYLLPAVRWALQNKERVVISTRTINLQEQLIHKDIPLLQRCMDEPFTACLVKGRGNYLCHRKLDRALSEATLFEDEEVIEQLHGIADWSEKTEDGSRADLPFIPGREVWDKVCSESDSCNMGRCPDKNRCFVGKARRSIATADIIVVNHHILFSDLAMRMEAGDFSTQAVLPHYQRVILDEAHSIEESATEYFGITASRGEVMATLSHLFRVDRGRERGLLPMIRQKLVKDCPTLFVREYESIQQRIDEKLLPAQAVVRDQMNVVFQALRDYTSGQCKQIGHSIQWRLTDGVLQEQELRELHRDVVLPAVEEMRELLKQIFGMVTTLDKIRPSGDEDDPPMLGEAQQLAAYGRRLERAANALSEGTSETLAANTVRWIQIDAENDNILRVTRCPLDVGKPLAEWLFGQLKTVVMTSATLAVQKQFDYLFGRLGLNEVDPNRLEALSLDSPFDFESQALLAMVEDLPTPDQHEYNDACVNFLEHLLKATRGRAFVLFTSFFALDYVHKKLEKILREQGLTPLRQGTATRTQLLDRFKADRSSVLFATDSFWEGVDVPGDALECVILTRLPFRVPTEPIQQARSEAIEENGGNSFMDYSVPQAVIKFRQGFGRLIRRRTDRGVILVLDKRILTKRYGKYFLNSLPRLNVVKGPQRGVYLSVQRFFNSDSEKEKADEPGN